MAINVRCPKCGSENVQLSNENHGHGCLYTIFFGIFYIFWVMIKWCIGFCILICWDWWYAIIRKKQGKGYTWKSKKWFSGKKRYFYCHECGHNFRGY